VSTRSWTLPPLTEVLAGSRGFSVPLTNRFRGVDHREGLLLHGPGGWGEFAPFPEYRTDESARWLAAAVEAAYDGWPPPIRDAVPVNAIVPAVAASTAARLVQEADCAAVKVKVGETGQSLADDVARVGAVRDALGPKGRIRIDANGAWSVAQAEQALVALAEFDLEYVEQPCADLAGCARLRRRVDVPVAVDEGLRKAEDPRRLVGLRDAADILVLKVPPLGGVRASLDVAQDYQLPCVVSSALDTSVGLAAGVALAAALPELPYACGLGSGRLLKFDVVADRFLPVAGRLEVRPVTVDDDACASAALPADRLAAWHDRLEATYRFLAATGGAA
jgi:O-succinylbenzoate synthase